MTYWTVFLFFYIVITGMIWSRLYKVIDKKESVKKEHPYQHAFSTLFVAFISPIFIILNPKKWLLIISNKKNIGYKD